MQGGGLAANAQACFVSANNAPTDIVSAMSGKERPNPCRNRIRGKSRSRFKKPVAVENAGTGMKSDQSKGAIDPVCDATGMPSRGFQLTVQESSVVTRVVVP